MTFDKGHVSADFPEFVTHLVNAATKLTTNLINAAVEFGAHILDLTTDLLNAGMETLDVSMDPCGEGANVVLDLAGKRIWMPIRATPTPKMENRTLKGMTMVEVNLTLEEEFPHKALITRTSGPCP